MSGSLKQPQELEKEERAWCCARVMDRLSPQGLLLCMVLCGSCLCNRKEIRLLVLGRAVGTCRGYHAGGGKPRGCDPPCLRMRRGGG